MKKYAIIVINKKDLGERLFEHRYITRRVLIEYTSYEDKPDSYMKMYLTRYYKGTRIVEVDNYFKDENSSHKYEFYDDGYSLKSVKLSDENELYATQITKLENIKRDYHHCEKFGPHEEFEAEDDDSAKLLFVLKKTEEEEN